MWAVIWLSGDVEKFKRTLEPAQARLQDLTNVCEEFYGISLWQNWRTESWKTLSLLETSTGSLSRTDVHVFSDSVLTWEITQPVQTKHGDQDL